MTSTAREIQSAEGGSRDVARAIRDASAIQRREIRIAQSHARDVERRQRRALGPIDTIDYEALDALRAVRNSLAEQIEPHELVPGSVNLDQRIFSEEPSGSISYGWSQRLRDTVRTVKLMLTLPF